MDSSIAPLIIGGIIALFALVAFVSYWQNKQRRDELSALATELKWQFVADTDYAYDDRYPQFPMFRQGQSRYAYNTLHGRIRIGEEFWSARMGDYHYQTTSHNGKETQTHNHYFSYLLIEIPYSTVPDLRIRAEGFFDTIANVFGFGDIDFESAEFSRRFHVKSSDKKFAYDVIHPAMMEFLLAEEPPSIEIDQGLCCLTACEHTWSADQFQIYCNWAYRFFELWPKHLIAELQSH